REISSNLIPFPITIFMNAFILTFPLPFILLGYNFFNYRRQPVLYRNKYPLWKKLVASNLGYPSFLHNIKKKHLWKYDVLEIKNPHLKSWKALTGNIANEWRKTSARIPSLKQRNVNNGRVVLTSFSSIVEERKWQLKFQIGLGDETDDELKRLNALKSADRDGKNKLWLLYTIPFMVPLTLGYFVSLFYGNIVLNFYTWFFYR
ncbi:MAG: A24 family peptidase C-terminal domain-containing protein, partial [Candidatus Odinarchaeota archaeon]